MSTSRKVFLYVGFALLVLFLSWRDFHRPVRRGPDVITALKEAEAARHGPFYSGAPLTHLAVAGTDRKAFALAVSTGREAVEAGVENGRLLLLPAGTKVRILDSGGEQGLWLAKVYIFSGPYAGTTAWMLYALVR